MVRGSGRVPSSPACRQPLSSRIPPRSSKNVGSPVGVRAPRAEKGQERGTRRSNLECSSGGRGRHIDPPGRCRTRAAGCVAEGTDCGPEGSTQDARIRAFPPRRRNPRPGKRLGQLGGGIVAKARPRSPGACLPHRFLPRSRICLPDGGPPRGGAGLPQRDADAPASPRRALLRPAAHRGLPGLNREISASRSRARTPPYRSPWMIQVGYRRMPRRSHRSGRAPGPLGSHSTYGRSSAAGPNRAFCSPHAGHQ